MRHARCPDCGVTFARWSPRQPTRKLCVECVETHAAIVRERAQAARHHPDFDLIAAEICKALDRIARLRETNMKAHRR